MEVSPTEAVSSPSFAREMGLLLAEFPGAKWVPYEPVGRGASMGAKRTLAQVGSDISDHMR